MKTRYLIPELAISYYIEKMEDSTYTVWRSGIKIAARLLSEREAKDIVRLDAVGQAKQIIANGEELLKKIDSKWHPIDRYGP